MKYNFVRENSNNVSLTFVLRYLGVCCLNNKLLIKFEKFFEILNKAVYCAKKFIVEIYVFNTTSLLNCEICC